MTSSSVDRVIRAAEKLMEERMAGYDSSHDALHVYRVRDTALKLTSTLSGNVDKTVVELAALFHDMNDHKYGSTEENTVSMKQVLQKGGALTSDQISEILRIVDNTSYSTEKKLRAAGTATEWHDNCLELQCVQDADRLDALGGIGVFRAAAFSGAKNNPLYHKDQTISSCYSHYSEKLLSLKNTLKTEAGKKAGEKRTLIMEKVIKEVELEVSMGDIV